MRSWPPREAGVTVTLDRDGLVLETAAPELPADVVSLLKASKPELLRILAWRDAAGAVFRAEPPPHCIPARWTKALRGLRRFVVEGWGDQAALLGWTKNELYRTPPLWSRIDLTGAALLIGDSQILAVTQDSIAIETTAGSQLKFRRIGREHVA